MEWPGTWSEFINNPIYVLVAAVAVWQFAQRVLIPWWLKQQEQAATHRAKRDDTQDEIARIRATHQNELAILRQEQEQDRHRGYFAAMDNTTEAIARLQQSQFELVATVSDLATQVRQTNDAIDNTHTVLLSLIEVAKSLRSEQSRTTKAFEALVNRVLMERGIQIERHSVEDETAELQLGWTEHKRKKPDDPDDYNRE